MVLKMVKIPLLILFCKLFDSLKSRIPVKVAHCIYQWCGEAACRRGARHGSTGGCCLHRVSPHDGTADRLWRRDEVRPDVLLEDQTDPGRRGLELLHRGVPVAQQGGGARRDGPGIPHAQPRSASGWALGVRVGREAAAAHVAQTEKESAPAEKPTHSAMSRVRKSSLIEGLFMTARTAGSDSGPGLRAKCVRRRATFFLPSRSPTTLPTAAGRQPAPRIGE